MGYITYPRTSGSGKDIKRAQAALSLIEQLLIYFNPNDLALLLSLVARIGWENLPTALRNRVLQLLYYDLYQKMRSHESDTAELQRSRMTLMTKTLIDIALMTAAKSEQPLHERMRASGQLSVSLVTRMNSASTKTGTQHHQDMLVFDNGIHIILTARANRAKYIVDQQKEVRVATRSYDPATLQTMKAAHKEGMLVTLNMLFAYENDNQQAPNAASPFNLANIPNEMMIYGAMRHHVLGFICQSDLVYRRQKEEALLGYKQVSMMFPAFYGQRIKQTDDAQSMGLPSIQADSHCPLTSRIFCNGFAFWVEDSQTQGTECRYLTILLAMVVRQFMAQRREATLVEWFDKLELALIELLTTVRVTRASNSLPQLHSKAEAAVMAAAIRQALQQNLADLNIPMTITLTNDLTWQDMTTELPNLESTDDSYVDFEC